MFVIRLQLKRHNFGQWESFRGLCDIPKMYLFLLWVSFDGGRTVPRKKTNCGDRRATLLHGSTSLARGRHTLFEPILQCVPQTHCNPSDLVSLIHRFCFLYSVDERRTAQSNYSGKFVSSADAMTAGRWMRIETSASQLPAHTQDDRGD